jgi:translation initiation factor IF-2
MAGGTSKKKLFQVAKELNLGKETIKDFLEKKGVKVTNINMRLDEDVYEMILNRFSKEKREAEKIHKRREERHRDDTPEVTPETAIESVEHNPVEATPEIVEETAEHQSADAPEVEEEVVVEATVESVDTEDTFVAADNTEVEQTVEPDTVSEPDQQDEAEILVDEVKTDIQEDVESETAENEEEISPEEVEAAVETSDEPEQVEEKDEEKPQVGDIIDHPMAKKFLQRQKQLEDEKKERQLATLKRLKEEEEKKTKKSRKKHKEEDAVVPGNVDVVDEQSERRKKKKGRKHDTDTLEEKEARRKKAFEMLRKEKRPIRPDTISADDDSMDVVKDGKRKKRKKKKEVDHQAVESALKKTLAEMRDTGSGRKKRKKQKETEDEVLETPKLKVTEFISTQDLANLMDVPVTEVITKCLELGLVVTINQRLDMDTIRLLAEEFGFEIEEEEELVTDFIEEDIEEEDNPEDLKPRAPIVTIMGHVDHGKTTLLDTIRETNVVAGESGGITQHLGAYKVKLDEGREITFLDTPGHEAFTAMRARGAQVTDIVVLVVAADDKVMPQTEEAIDHALAAGVSIVIAINKVDKPAANPEAIRKQLADRNILVEDWGGQYGCVEISAKTGKGVDDLLERILLEAELLDLKANPNKRAKGTVLDARIDKGKGTVANVLIQEGTLRVGDIFIVGQFWGRVRAMFDEAGKKIDAAGPSTPVQILGIDGIPEAGDRLLVLNDERKAREIATKRQQLKREQDFRQVKLLTLDELSKQIQTGDVKELKLLVKADVDGSAQALTDSLLKLNTNDVTVNVIRRAVGPITESDVILAAASQAIIIGFHVRPTLKAKELAEREKVDIRLYKVIYDVIEDVEKALEGLLEPIEREVVLGQAEVREVYKISRIGTVGGCYVLNGKLVRNAKVRIVRNDVEIYEGKLDSLKRFKDDVKEVAAGFECGLTVSNFNDLKVGDIIEAYEVVMEAQSLR